MPSQPVRDFLARDPCPQSLYEQGCFLEVPSTCISCATIFSTKKWGFVYVRCLVYWNCFFLNRCVQLTIMVSVHKTLLVGSFQMSNIAIYCSRWTFGWNRQIVLKRMVSFEFLTDFIPKTRLHCFHHGSNRKQLSIKLIDKNLGYR